MSIMDHTGHIWVTAFNDLAEQLLGTTANNLVQMKVRGGAIFRRGAIIDTVTCNRRTMRRLSLECLPKLKQRPCSSSAVRDKIRSR